MWFFCLRAERGDLYSRIDWFHLRFVQSWISHFLERFHWLNEAFSFPSLKKKSILMCKKVSVRLSDFIPYHLKQCWAHKVSIVPKNSSFLPSPINAGYDQTKSPRSTVKVLTGQSCLTLCGPVDCSPSGSSVYGILPARILEWAAIPFYRGSSQPRNKASPALQADSLPS